MNSCRGPRTSAGRLTGRGCTTHRWTTTKRWRIEKVPSQGGPPVVDSDRRRRACAGGRAHRAVLRDARASGRSGAWDWEFRRASPEDGPSEVLTCVPGSQMPVSKLFASMSLSRDGRCLALPMIAAPPSNICVMPVEGGTFTPVIDFGDRATLIARQVSWSPDGHRFMRPSPRSAPTSFCWTDSFETQHEDVGGHRHRHARRGPRRDRRRRGARRDRFRAADRAATLARAPPSHESLTDRSPRTVARAPRAPPRRDRARCAAPAPARAARSGRPPPVRRSAGRRPGASTRAASSGLRRP